MTIAYIVAGGNERAATAKKPARSSGTHAAFAAAVHPIYAEARTLYPEQILKLLPRGM
jgi:hypothetical protein